MTFLPLLFAIYAGEDDRNLAERLKRREPSVMGDLYDRYGKLVFSLIYRIVRDIGVAEDLVQETFLRVWNRAQGFDAERGALGSWLLAVEKCRVAPWNWKPPSIPRFSLTLRLRCSARTVPGGCAERSNA
jgi:RNA polymerase sigma-70 factor (ECF subfamily)